MKRLLAPILIFMALFIVDGVGAQEMSGNFFRALDGKWRGSGEVVAGKYKGTRFQCNFNSLSGLATIDLLLDGTCRMGLFSQSLKAQVRGSKNGVLSGSFNDGARGEGMDITAGKIGKDHVVLDLLRDNLQGKMLAQLKNKNTMHITLSVKVSEHFIPVVGLDLQRNNASLAQNLTGN